MVDSVALLVLVSGFVGLAFAALYAKDTARIHVGPSDSASAQLVHSQFDGATPYMDKIYMISEAISEGANAFLFKEYQYMAVFMVIFSGILGGFLSARPAPATTFDALLCVVAFLAGAVTSIVAGFIGMKIAVFSNSRTAISATHSWGAAFVCAFKAGIVMGFSLTALGMMVLWVLISIFQMYYSDAYTNPETCRRMYEALAGYGLGGSSIALFGRVGGGIYTKAADVGADLVGKFENDLNEDDPKNPAVIADNVGDNVGDIAGMGADLFGSFAESACAAMVIASQSVATKAGADGIVATAGLSSNVQAMSLPLVITAVGIFACLITSFTGTHLCVVKGEEDIEPSLKRQLMVSTLIMTPLCYLICAVYLPAEGFYIVGHSHIVHAAGSVATHSVPSLVRPIHVFFSICCGLWSGLIIGYITEYFTSHSYSPVRQVAGACETGAATNIIYGLALGYKSVIIPVFCLAGTIYVSYSCAGMYGIACAALGILSTLPIGLTIDAYGPICDNAGGIAEMSHMPEEVREKTDALDAAGNTTAAIGKGFAIGSAALVGLALFGAFVTITLSDPPGPDGVSQPPVVDILQPFQFAGLLIGAMLPYWFSAMTMKSVGKAALAMVVEVRRQFRENPGILRGTADPDYTRCVAISTEASLKEMIPPGALVMLTPLFVGFLFGVEALAGVLAGVLVSGVQMAISSSNTGGAWDNAKKYIEAGNMGEGKGKGSDVHKAAVIGDTVGDPLKDTSGPALNILIKLSAIISVVFGTAFPSKAKGGLLVQLFGNVLG